MKILIVDDSSTMRRILKNCLSKLSYEDVLEAGDGLEAQKVLEKNKDVPDDPNSEWNKSRFN